MRLPPQAQGAEAYVTREPVPRIAPDEADQWYVIRYPFARAVIPVVSPVNMVSLSAIND